MCYQCGESPAPQGQQSLVRHVSAGKVQMKNSDSPRDGTKRDRKRTERAGASMDSELFELAERFRAAKDPEQVKRLGDQLGRFVFGECQVQEKQIPRGLKPARNDKKQGLLRRS